MAPPLALSGLRVEKDMDPSLAEQDQAQERKPKKWRAQSLVEFTIMLPVIMLLLSGLVEFGFLLNNYLDLIDAARDVARAAADDDPVHDCRGAFHPSPVRSMSDTDCGEPIFEPFGFYQRSFDALSGVLSGNREISINEANGDDMVISIFSVSGGVATRYPPLYNDGRCDQGGEYGWRLYCNQPSAMSDAEVASRLQAIAPGQGFVMVELYFNYHMKLGLPWITAFVHDPVLLHAYAIMPNVRAAP
jgi:hypothetical protein